MKIIAQQGQRVLIDLGRGRGQVLDRATNKKYPPNFIGSILGRGYWTPVESAQTHKHLPGEHDQLKHAPQTGRVQMQSPAERHAAYEAMRKLDPQKYPLTADEVYGPLSTQTSVAPKPKRSRPKPVTTVSAAKARLKALGFDVRTVADLKKDDLVETMREIEDGVNAMLDIIPGFTLKGLGIEILGSLDDGLADYSNTENVIRIGKSEGQSIVHELAHYWDAQLAAPRGPNDFAFATDRDLPSHVAVIQAVEVLPVYERWLAEDRMFGDSDYLTQPVEIIARMIDQYVYSKNKAHQYNISQRYPEKHGLSWVPQAAFSREIAPLVEAMLGITKKSLSERVSRLIGRRT